MFSNVDSTNNNAPKEAKKNSGTSLLVSVPHPVAIQIPGFMDAKSTGSLLSTCKLFKEKSDLVWKNKFKNDFFSANKQYIIDRMRNDDYFREKLDGKEDKNISWANLYALCHEMIYGENIRTANKDIQTIIDSCKSMRNSHHDDICEYKNDTLPADLIPLFELPNGFEDHFKKGNDFYTFNHNDNTTTESWLKKINHLIASNHSGYTTNKFYSWLKKCITPTHHKGDSKSESTSLTATMPKARHLDWHKILLEMVGEDENETSYFTNQKKEVFFSPYQLIHIAIRYAKFEIFVDLMERNKDSFCNDNKKNFIEYATKNGRLDIVKMLAEHYKVPIDSTIDDIIFTNTLKYAAKYARYEIMDYLLSKTIREPTQDYAYLLDAATNSNKLTLVKYLLGKSKTTIDSLIKRDEEHWMVRRYLSQDKCDPNPQSKPATRRASLP